MKVHVFSGPYNANDETLTLHEAFVLIESQETLQQNSDNYLGFTSDKSDRAIIQFTRVDLARWEIEVPMFSGNEQIKYLRSIITHNMVYAVTQEFFTSNGQLNQALVRLDYSLFLSICRARWGIEFTEVDQESNR